MDWPLVLGFGAAAVTTGGVVMKSWKWTMNGRREKSIEKELARRAPQLEHSYQLRPRSDQWKVEHGSGEIAYVELGTAAARQCPATLGYYEAIGVSNDVGGILLAELAKAERDDCLRDIPDAFRDRVTQVVCNNLPGGLHGATVEEAEQMRDMCYHDVLIATEKWLRYLDSHTTHELLIVRASPGGHMALLPTIIATYRTRYRHKPIYLMTILDHKDVVRERFPAMRALFAQQVNGTIVLDNLHDHQRNDVGAQILFPAMSAGSLLGSLPTQIGNALSLVFARSRKVRYATLSVWAETLPVKHIPATSDLEEVYYTKSNLVEERITKGIKILIEQQELQSVPLDPAALGHTRLIYVVAPIIPDPDFTRLTARIDSNLKQWRNNTDRNLLIHYVSTGANLSSERGEVPLVIVLVQPLADDGGGLDRLARDANQPSPDGLLEDTALPKKVRRLNSYPR
jgi:hypothetical protein